MSEFKSQGALRRMTESNLVEYAHSIGVEASVDDPKEETVRKVIERQQWLEEHTVPADPPDAMPDDPSRQPVTAESVMPDHDSSTELDEESQPADLPEDAHDFESDENLDNDFIDTPDDDYARHISAMNDLANRIWEGQSISLPLRERVTRIKTRLNEKGYTGDDIDFLMLPAKGFEAYI